MRDHNENKKKKLVYIAGPLASNAKGSWSGVSLWKLMQNVRAAQEIALEVWRAGGVAICPHLNTLDFEGELDHTTWIEGDLVILERCDAIVMCPGWAQSPGATGEFEYAAKLRLPAYLADKSTLTDRIVFAQGPRAIKTFAAFVDPEAGATK